MQNECTVCYTVVILYYHPLFTGDLCSDLADFHSMLSGFHETHSLVMSKGNASFTASVLAWHTGFNELMVGEDTTLNPLLRYILPL